MAWPDIVEAACAFPTAGHDDTNAKTIVHVTDVFSWLRKGWLGQIHEIDWQAKHPHFQEITSRRIICQIIPECVSGTDFEQHHNYGLFCHVAGAFYSPAIRLSEHWLPILAGQY